MAHQRSCIAAVVMAVVMGWTRAAASEQPKAAVAPPSITESHARVRGVGLRVAAVVIEAAAQSKTFRGLIEQVNATDGIVYVVEGECGHGVRACLTFAITLAGPNRVLRILIDGRKTDREAMRSIGHELQHAVKVLSNPTVRSLGEMYQLYDRICNQCGLRFETDAATRAGEAVRDELQKSAAAGHVMDFGGARVTASRPPSEHAASSRRQEIERSDASPRLRSARSVTDGSALTVHAYLPRRSLGEGGKVGLYNFPLFSASAASRPAV